MGAYGLSAISVHAPQLAVPARFSVESSAADALSR
jgi:hypothetical protein